MSGRTLNDLISEIPAPLVKMIKQQARATLLDQVLAITDDHIADCHARSRRTMQRLRKKLISTLRPQPSAGASEAES